MIRRHVALDGHSRQRESVQNKSYGTSSPVNNNGVAAKMRNMMLSAAFSFLFLMLCLFIVNGDLGLSALLSLSVVCICFAACSIRFSWICFVASLMMSGLSVQILGFGLLPEHAFMVILLCHGARIGFRRTRLSRSSSSGTINIKMTVAGILIVSWFLVLAAFSALNAPSPDQSLRLMAWVALNLLAVFVVTSARNKHPSLVSDGLKTSLAVMLVFITGWLVANATSTPNIFVEADYASSTYRLKGLMLEPNLLAAVSLLWLCIGYIYQHEMPKITYWLAIAVLSFGIFMTYTRAAWIVLILLVARLAWTGAAKQRGLVFCAFLIVVPLLALVISGGISYSSASILDTIQMRFESLLDFQSGTGAYRTRTWEVAWKEIQLDGWWTGHGYNSFSQTHFSNETSDGTLYLGLLWLSLIYDGGLLAFIAFTAAFLTLWLNSRSGSTWFFVAFIILSTSTNPTWFMFPWALAALSITRKIETKPQTLLETPILR